MRTTEQSMALVDRVIRFSLTFPRFIVFICGILALIAFASSQRVTLKTSNLDLVSPNLPEVRKFLNFTDEFGTPNVLVIVLKGTSSSELSATIDLLGSKIRGLSGVRRVIDKTPSISGFGLSADYLSAKDKSAYYIFVQPSDPRSDVTALEPLLKSIRQLIENENLPEKGLTYGFTGIPQYALDDRDIIQKDISKYSMLSLFLVFLLFVAAFHSVRRPLLATVTLVTSVIFTFGLVGIFPGHLTLLSAPFAAMIFGLGDYGSHVISNAEDLIEKGLSEKDAFFESLRKLKLALSGSALTTAGGFFVLWKSGFHGFKELGIIAGTNVLLCLALTYTLFPALIAIFGTNHKPDYQRRSLILRSVAAIQSRYVAGVLLLLSLLSLWYINVPFDSNYLNLQPTGSPAVKLEREMISNSDYSPYFAVFSVNSIEHASELTKMLRANPIVGTVRSISDVAEVFGPQGFDISILPNEYQGVFNSPRGNFAVFAYPKGNIWEPGVEESFIEQMRKLDPNVTGMPFLGHEMVQLSKTALTVTGKYAIIVLLVVILSHFRSPLLVVTSMVVPLLSVLLMFGCMNLFGIAFNPLNVMALPIVLGIAVDNGVHIIHRFTIEHGDIEKTLQGTGRGVVLATVTTIAGFASLIPTSHLGLRSLCLTLTMGVTITLIVSLILLPWLLTQMRGILVGHAAAK